MNEVQRQSAVRLLPSLLRILRQTHPWGAAGLGVITVFNSLMPMAELFILQVLLDGLAGLAGAGDELFFELLPWILGLAGLALLSTVFDMVAGVIRVDVQERVGDYEGALTTYNDLLERYPDMTEAQQRKRHLVVLIGGGNAINGVGPRNPKRQQ